MDYILQAEDLTPAHVGRRVRVTVLPGPVVEDELISFRADSMEGKLRIFLRFASTTPRTPRDSSDEFPVMPSASIELIGHRKKLT